MLERVYVYLDGEVDEDERRKIRHHLDECAPCLRLYGLEQAVKSLVARCCAAEAAPRGLRESVLIRLREVSVHTGTIDYPR